MEYDIEAYLEGNLSEADRAAFETELASNPVFREEVALQGQIRQRLKQQLLREQVSTALNKPDGTSSKSNWGTLLGLALLVAVGIYYFTQQDRQPSAVPEESTLPVETPREPSAPPSSVAPEESEELVPTPPRQEVPPPPKEKKTEMPIAQNNSPKELSAPLYPGPNVRGANAGNEAWKNLVDSLWYTNFPPAQMTFPAPWESSAKLLEERKFPRAYVQLQRLERIHADNDTLRYLKGYCLLEMGEGEEAARYFEKLEEKNPSWDDQLEWYQGLAYLIRGDQEQALSIFKKIVPKNNHAYALQAKKAVSVMGRE